MSLLPQETEGGVLQFQETEPHWPSFWASYSNNFLFSINKSVANWAFHLKNQGRILQDSEQYWVLLRTLNFPWN